MAYILVACEESQRVCAAFREKGHIAFSCDLMPCSGGHPEWHIHGDVLDVLYPPTYFQTMVCLVHAVPKWDLIIAHPPCTRLCNSGQRWRFWGSDAERKTKERETVDAIEFFMTFANLRNCDHIAIETRSGSCPAFTENRIVFIIRMISPVKPIAKKRVCGCGDCRRSNRHNHSHPNNGHKMFGKHISTEKHIPGIHPKPHGCGAKHQLV